MSMKPALVTSALAILVLAACSSGNTTIAVVDADASQSVAGVVVAVDGDLHHVESFTIRTEDGTDLSFAPKVDARFDGGPFGHVRDHLASGTPILLEYRSLDDGSRLALSAGDL